MKKKWKEYFPHGEMYVKIFRMMKLCTCLLLCSVMSISGKCTGATCKNELGAEGGDVGRGDLGFREKE